MSLLTNPLGLPTVLAIVNWVGFVVCWRTLTGHVAWSVHRTADTNKTVRPPIENWIIAAVPCAALSLLWPAVLLFTVRWPRPRGAELEAETYLRKMAHESVQLESSKLEQHLLGEVVDA